MKVHSQMEIDLLNAFRQLGTEDKNAIIDQIKQWIQLYKPKKH